MGRCRFWLAFAVVAFLTAGLSGADNDAQPPARVRGQLPQLWSKLGLTDEQKQEIYQARAQYRGRIEDLQRQINKLRREEMAAMQKVLTPSQKDRLKELVSERAGSSTAPKEKARPVSTKPEGGSK